MKKNYFTIHKNKKAKKAKYSSRYTKKDIEKMTKCLEYVVNLIEEFSIRVRQLEEKKHTEN